MTSGAPSGGRTSAATVRAGSRVGGSGSMGSLDQIVAHRSPGSPGRSGYPVLTAEYSGPGETELWVSVRTHTSASMRSSQPTILALRAVSFGRTRARFHVAIFRLMRSPSHGAIICSATASRYPCLLYTSDAADEEDSVDLGGRRI